MIEGLFLFLLALAALCVAVWFYILLPAGMARNRGRSEIGWVLLSVIFSPILACLLLWLLGPNPDARD